MQNKIMHLFIQTVIFCLHSLYNQNVFANAKGIVGQNVRTVSKNEITSVVCILKINGPIYNLENHVWCTGTLITYEHVLTAAHCFNDIENSYLQVVAESVNLNLGLMYYPAWWIIHDSWASNQKRSIDYQPNDIAVMKLTNRIFNRFNRIILPALSNIPNHQLYGLEVAIAGWGVSNDGKCVSVLDKVKLKIKTHHQCNNIIQLLGKGSFKKKAYLPQHMLCTISDPFALLDNGDAGGPLFYGHMLLAVNNGKYPITDEFHPEKINVHTDIAYYKTFIDSTINQ